MSRKIINLDKHPYLALLGGLSALFIPIIGPIFNSFFFYIKCEPTRRSQHMASVLCTILHVSLIINNYDAIIRIF